MKKIIFLLSLLSAVLLLISGCAQQTPMAVVDIPAETGSAASTSEFELIYPNLTYPGAYNGPLFDTSLQIGSEGNMDKYFENFDRNGMNFFIGYFKIDYPPQRDLLMNNKGLGYALYAVQKHPYRIIPYISLSLPGEEALKILGSEMTGRLRSNLDAVREIAGQDFVKGFGELDVMDYTGYHADSKQITDIYGLAKEKNIMVMFHPAVGEAGRVKNVIEKYPDMNFLIHMYRTDLKKDRESYIDLLKTHENLFFSIDVDHMMFLPQESVGMLYQYEEYEESSVKNAALFFVRGFNDIDKVSVRYEALVNNAIVDYKPLIDAAPSKVMWGTEMGPKYNFEPEVYDLIIKFSRLFIGKLEPRHQEAFAYRNALRVFGFGVTVDPSLPITDASAWPQCTTMQSLSCELESEVCGKEDTPEKEKCMEKCLFDLKCYALAD